MSLLITNVTNQKQLYFFSFDGEIYKSHNTEQFSTKERFLYDLMEDPTSPFEVISEAQRFLTDDFLFLTSNLDFFYNQKRNIVYYPCWFLSSRFNSEHVPVLPDQLIENHNRKYTLSSFNGVLRTHRVELYIKLRQRMNITNDKFLVRLGDSPISVDGEELDLFFHPSELSEGIYDAFKELPESEFKGRDNDHSVTNDAYTDTYINLVTETSVVDFFVSEKVWKPFLAGQFPLVLACHGTVQYLRDCGFDVFDDIIDHSYDLVPDWHKRIDMIIEQIDYLQTLNLNDLFKKTKHRRVMNRLNFYSKECFDFITSKLPSGFLNVSVD